MRLRTLGGLALQGSDLRWPKPLALLTYLTLEGPQDRRFLAELFWPQASDPRKSLTVALAQLRNRAPGAAEADRARVWSHASIDVRDLLSELDAGRPARAVDAYAGPFLHGVHVRGAGEELDEWLLGTRELIAQRVAAGHLALAEQAAGRGRQRAAAALAESALHVPGAPPAEPRVLRRLYPLLTAGDSPLAGSVRDQADELGLDLPEPLAPPPDGPSPTMHVSERAPGPRRPGSAPFVGRRHELGMVDELLANPEGRLGTILGPPGAGKTRLASEVERREGGSDAWDGVHWIGVSDADDAPPLAVRLLQALGRAAAHDESWEALAQILGRERHLVILDDAQHLTDEVDDLAPLLDACPSTWILATSQLRLGLAREHVAPMGGLAYPEHDDLEPDDAVRYDAVALFLARARRLRPTFALTREVLPHVLEVCRRTGGLPLALELAASWARLLSPAEIAAELAHGLDQLPSQDRDVPARHRTLLAAFDGAWWRLSPRNREAASELATFHGRFTRDAARAVAGAGPSRLAALTDASLLTWDGSGHYELHPIVRRLARQRVDPRRRVAARARHAEFVLETLARQGEGFRAGAAPLARLPVRDLVDAWHWAAAHGRDTLRSAALDGLGWALFLHGRSDLGLRLMDEDTEDGRVLWLPRHHAMYLVQLNRFGEAVTVLDEAIAATPDRPPLERAHELRLLGVARSLQNPPDRGRARSAFGEAMEIYERLGDAEGVAMMLNNLAYDAAGADEALNLADRAITVARAADQPHALAMALTTRAELLFRRLGDGHAAAEAVAEGAALHDTTAFAVQQADALLLHAEILLANDDPAGAHGRIERLLTLCSDFDAGPAAARRAAGLALRRRATAKRGSTSPSV